MSVGLVERARAVMWVAAASLLVATTAEAAPDPPRRHMLRFAGAAGITLYGVEPTLYGVGFGLGYEYRPIEYLGVSARYGALFFPGEQSFDGDAGAYHGVGGAVWLHPWPSLARGDLWLSVGGDAVLTGDEVFGGVEVALGFDVRMARFLRFGPNLRYTHVFAEEGGWGVLQVVVALVGLLGADRQPPADRDYDGIADREDRCPDDPEDFDHFRDDDGCPEDDNDRDGILDWDDACVREAEDRDGDRDEDGCPEDPEDRDGDGLADLDDDCPDHPEDLDLFEDDDGCPDLDDDRDGIPDIDDRCQLEPETVNEYRDRDGCPDEVPEALVTLRSLGERVLFEHDDDQPVEGAGATLVRVAELMTEHPEWRQVRIEGHASDSGEEAYNLALSRRRALAVRDALVERYGVDPGRLRVVAYGESRPEAEGGSEEARAQNRRVVFELEAVAGGP